MNRRRALGALIGGIAAARARWVMGAGDGLLLFLCGDVMTGRGVDQILAHPSEPTLYEPYVKDARDYVALAERRSGPVAAPVDFSYPWGDALATLASVRPDFRIINLETSVTAHAEPWPHKGIQYRMHPANVPCLLALEPDCCVLANNHTLDWGRDGLRETVAVLRAAGIRTAGAGASAGEAAAPAELTAGAHRVLVFAYALPSSGVPLRWAATPAAAGINLLPDLSRRSATRVVRHVRANKRPNDVVVVSLHWGGNWGYDIPDEQITFAHHIIDGGDVDVVHGHSSHHPKGIEVYNGRPVIYGCGDFINDYEGISGHEEYRPDLVLMYFVRVDPTVGTLLRLTMSPLRIRQLRLNRVDGNETRWLATMLTREGERFGTGATITPTGDLELSWPAGADVAR